LILIYLSGQCSRRIYSWGAPGSGKPIEVFMNKPIIWLIFLISLALFALVIAEKQ